MTGPLNMNGQVINGVAVGNSPGSVATLAQAMPIGAIIDFPAAPPAGWAACYGQALSRTTYAALFAVIGTSFGPGDGSTTFNLPDARGLVVAGYDAMGGVSSGRLPASFGATIGERSTILNASQLPNLTRPLVGTPGNVSVTTVSNNIVTASGISNIGPGGGGGGLLNSGSVGPQGSIGTFTPQGTVNIGGSDQPHNTVQPTLVLNKIIRVSYDG